MFYLYYYLKLNSYNIKITLNFYKINFLIRINLI